MLVKIQKTFNANFVRTSDTIVIHNMCAMFFMVMTGRASMEKFRVGVPIMNPHQSRSLGLL